MRCPYELDFGGVVGYGVERAVVGRCGAVVDGKDRVTKG
jgi:hypothetical protein